MTYLFDEKFYNKNIFFLQVRNVFAKILLK